MPAFLQPVTLTGRHVRLEPLSPHHKDGLIDATRDGELWRLWYTSAPAPEDMQTEIDRRLSLFEQGSMLPFTVFNQIDGQIDSQIAGMTTYMNVDAINRRVEIGSTWYARRVQRTALNTEAKLLLLGHAFDQLQCIAVEFRTHHLNQQSRRAIERLGARLDGILRSHAIGTEGALRDTCVYSITAAEWPAVRMHLNWQLDKPR